MNRYRLLLFPSIMAFILSPVIHADSDSERAASPYSVALGATYPARVYWGDTHVHSMNSIDSGAFGNRLGPADAYRFAKGEQVVSSTGLPAKLSRPLDFLVVADHSDNMGGITRLLAEDESAFSHNTARRWSRELKQGGEVEANAGMEIVATFLLEDFPQELKTLPGSDAFESAWSQNVQAAQAANQPGTFTAFIGYEWTSGPEYNNLHRVIVYRDDAKTAGQVEPMLTMRPHGSDDPRDLWNWMANYERTTGGRVLAIPHNGNMSNGLMFAEVDPFTAKPLDKDYLAARSRWEPLYEVTQIKGDGEAHPLLSPDDEFADFANWDWSNLNLSVPKTSNMLPYEYARSALQLGLQIDLREGVNPFKFGMIGSTDSHTSLATADSNNFFGKHPGNEPGPERVIEPWATLSGKPLPSTDLLASGYAGIWATENTREALFDAMLRKEVYATTGPRITVRFFGGWSFDHADAHNPDIARVGYDKGVPMGGDLKSAPEGKSPTFLIAASRDPIGANLDRIQIIKGWVAEDGARHEKVYDVSWSGERKLNQQGKLPPVGNTVDLKTATWSNSIGAGELMSTWTDPDFNPRLRAVYYVRVLEIPTPNWPAYDGAVYGTDPPAGATLVHQERAYTSPIWYTP